MVILKRVKHYIFHNMLLSIVYMIIFVALFVVFTINTASKRQLEELQSSVGNSVLIKRYWQMGEMTGLEHFKNHEIDKYVDFPEVQGYNLLSYGEKLVGGCQYYIYDEEKYRLKQRTIERFYAENELGEYIPDQYFRVLGVTDSERAPYFARYGLKLVQGEPITVREDGEPMALVSDNFARVNSLKIGDKISLSQDNSKMAYELLETDEVLTVTINGIFESAMNNGIMPTLNYDNVLILPETTLGTAFPDAAPAQVIIYLKDAYDVQGYVKEIEKLAAQDPGFRYEIIWDKELYETISRPMQEVTKLGSLLFAIVLIGCVIILLVIGAMNIAGHSREWGILLSLGQTRWRIALQGMSEALFPLIVGTLLAIVIGMPVVSHAGKQMEAYYVANVKEENMERRLEQERITNRTEGINTQYENLETSQIILPEKLELQVDVEIMLRFVVMVMVVSPMIFWLQIFVVMHFKSTKKLLEARG